MLSGKKVMQGCVFARGQNDANATAFGLNVP